MINSALNFIRHFCFKFFSDFQFTGNEGIEHFGRFAVAVEDDFLVLKQLAGEALPWWALRELFRLDAFKPVLDRAWELHQNRRNPFAFFERKGMSGASDFLIRWQRDEAMADWPCRNVLHVSMNGKVNAGIRCWLGDLVPLWEHLREAAVETELQVWETEVFDLFGVDVERPEDRTSPPWEEDETPEDPFVRQHVEDEPDNPFANPLVRIIRPNPGDDGEVVAL